MKTDPFLTSESAGGNPSPRAADLLGSVAGSPELRPESVQRVPIIEEVLQITKEAVDQGGYRIVKRVSTHEQLVDELLRTEHVEIERRQINNAIADDAIPGVRQEGDTLIIPVIEEMLITVKRLILVEEVRITRIHGTQRNPQTVTLRKESVEIERLAAEQPSRDKSS